MWKIRRPMTTALGKLCGLFTGITFTLLSWLRYCYKGRKFVLGIIAGLLVILLTLFSKVSGTKRG
jgi:Mg/Co/Ni transporter MgtE